MLAFGIKEAKGWFFDREVVMKAVDRATADALRKAGSLIRMNARRSMKKAGKDDPPAPPGSPPRARTGLLKKFVFYAYDQESKSVIVGPAFLSGGRRNPTVPEILEYGGHQVVRRISRKRAFEDGRRVRKPTVVERRVKYEPRPYMTPSLEKIKPKMPELWKDILSR